MSGTLSGFCCGVGLLSGVIAVGGDHVPQAAAKPRATLVVKVPRGLLPSADYWLYVNGSIVSAPPRAAFADLSTEFMHLRASPENAAEHYVDASGRAATSENGRFTYLRPGLHERVFEAHRPIQLAAGRSVVELLTRSVNASFPFAVARIEVQLRAGETREIEFGIPPRTDEMKIARAIGRPWSAVPEDNLNYAQDNFNRASKEYEQLAMVGVLNEALLNLPDPPARSVFAALPDAIGGGRDLDARQIGLIVDALESDYSFPLIGSDWVFAKADDTILQVVKLLDLKVSAHNKRIADFRQIVKRLEAVKRP